MIVDQTEAFARCYHCSRDVPLSQAILVEGPEEIISGEGLYSYTVRRGLYACSPECQVRVLHEQ